MAYWLSNIDEYSIHCNDCGIRMYTVSAYLMDQNKKIYDNLVCEDCAPKPNNKMSTEIVKKPTLSEILNLPPEIIQALTPTQQGWLNLEANKRGTEKVLQAAKLELQGILLKPGETITEIEASIELYKSKWNALVDRRKLFTTPINTKIIYALMTYEKETDYKECANFKALETTLLNKKRADKAKADSAKNKTNEAAQIKLAISNYWATCDANFTMKWKNFIANSYLAMLTVGIYSEQTRKEIEDDINTDRFPMPTPFSAQYHTPEEKKEIVKTVPAKEIGVTRLALIKELNDTWANFYADKAAGTGSKVVEAKTEEVQAIAEELAQDVAVNTLVAAAENTAPEIVPEGKKLKKKIIIAVEDSEQFWIKITSAILRSPSIREYKTKKGSWLTFDLNKMIACVEKYMQETGEVLDGIEFKEEDVL